MGLVIVLCYRCKAVSTGGTSMDAQSERDQRVLTHFRDLEKAGAYVAIDEPALQMALMNGWGMIAGHDPSDHSQVQIKLTEAGRRAAGIPS